MNTPTKPSSALLSQNVSDAVAAFQALRPLSDALDRAAQIVAASLTRGHKVLTCGNGGSAADAAHLATEFVCRYCDDRRGYPAICLNDTGSTLTAVCNDYGPHHIFARQVSAFASTGDVLLAFSTSGKSPNITAALQAARDARIDSIAFLGRDGGQCRGLATVELIVPGTSTARIQECHQLLLHTLCEMIEPALKNPARAATSK